MMRPSDSALKKLEEGGSYALAAASLHWRHIADLVEFTVLIGFIPVRVRKSHYEMVAHEVRPQALVMALLDEAGLRLP